MATIKDKYYTKLLETLFDYNDNHNAPLSHDNLWKAISTVMAEKEEEEREAEWNAHNVTMDNFCHQSPVTTNTQGEIANVTNERQNTSDILAISLKVFNGLTIQSTINNSAY